MIANRSSSSRPISAANESSPLRAFSIWSSKPSICCSIASTHVACWPAASIRPAKSIIRRLTGNVDAFSRIARRRFLTSSSLAVCSSIVASIWTNWPGASSGNCT